MKETVYKLQIGDERISVTLYKESFRIKKPIAEAGELSMMRIIHQHSAYEIFFVLDGSLAIVTKERTEHFGRGAVIVPPCFYHYSVSREARGYGMYVSFDSFGDSEGSFLRTVTEALGKGLTVLPLGEEEDFYLRGLCDVCEGERPEEDATPLLTLLFSALLRPFRTQTSSADRQTEKSGQYINTIDTYLSEHYSEPIHLSDLADALYLCTKQITRIIRRQYHCTFTELLNSKRLSVACMLLRYTDMKMSEIAESVGYANENYFYTLFRRTYGTTPSRYRSDAKSNL